MKPSIISLIVAATLCWLPLKVSAQDAAGVMVEFDDLPVQFEITDLKRTDDNTTLMLRGVIKNPSGQAVGLNYVYDMSLIDFKNRRKYLVIKDSSLECVCSSNSSVTAQPDNTIHVWAKFPAPPESVTTFSFGWGKAQPTTVQITK